MKALRRFSGALHNEGKAFLKEHSWFYDNGIFKIPSYYEILEIKDFSGAKSDKNYAIKCDGDSKLLKYEANIYKELRSIKNISTLVDFFIIDNRSYMVLDLFELNLRSPKVIAKD